MSKQKAAAVIFYDEPLRSVELSFCTDRLFSLLTLLSDFPALFQGFPDGPPSPFYVMVEVGVWGE